MTLYVPKVLFLLLKYSKILFLLKPRFTSTQMCVNLTTLSNHKVSFQCSVTSSCPWLRTHQLHNKCEDTTTQSVQALASGYKVWVRFLVEDLNYLLSPWSDLFSESLGFPFSGYWKIKRPEHVAGSLPTSNHKVNAWSFTSTPLKCWCARAWR